MIKLENFKLGRNLETKKYILNIAITDSRPPLTRKYSYSGEVENISCALQHTFDFSTFVLENTSIPVYYDNISIDLIHGYSTLIILEAGGFVLRIRIKTEEQSKEPETFD